MVVFNLVVELFAIAVWVIEPLSDVVSVVFTVKYVVPVS